MYENDWNIEKLVLKRNDFCIFSILFTYKACSHQHRNIQINISSLTVQLDFIRHIVWSLKVLLFFFFIALHFSLSSCSQCSSSFSNQYWCTVYSNFYFQFQMISSTFSLRFNLVNNDYILTIKHYDCREWVKRNFSSLL